MSNSPLTAQDRCSRCGAQAYARTMHGESGTLELLWCRHHLHKHEDKLRPNLVRDETHLLKQEPQPA